MTDNINDINEKEVTPVEAEGRSGNFQEADCNEGPRSNCAVRVPYGYGAHCAVPVLLDAYIVVEDVGGVQCSRSHALAPAVQMVELCGGVRCGRA